MKAETENKEHTHMLEIEEKSCLVKLVQGLSSQFIASKVKDVGNLVFPAW